ncbi:hypothetical protein [Dongia sedimenti]|uniref:Secreted protein n=1 Tax=Dongia sedimenti TaxID=3064282 RepID=A0ABU0YVW3_9PROT|nr:hypothetical protein [Rhodospirillaceae bacterium R-7]
MKILLALFALLMMVATATAQDVYVDGYYRSNGTYVQPHYRSAPDGDSSNNWTTRGNVNPYTGAVGTRNPDSSFGGGNYGNGDGGYGSNLGDSVFGGSRSNCNSLLSTC